jgi:hypothetical protein
MRNPAVPVSSARQVANFSCSVCAEPHEIKFKNGAVRNGAGAYRNLALEAVADIVDRRLSAATVSSSGSEVVAEHTERTAPASGAAASASPDEESVAREYGADDTDGQGRVSLNGTAPTSQEREAHADGDAFPQPPPAVAVVLERTIALPVEQPDVVDESRAASSPPPIKSSLNPDEDKERVPSTGSVAADAVDASVAPGLQSAQIADDDTRATESGEKAGDESDDSDDQETNSVLAHEAAAESASVRSQQTLLPSSSSSSSSGLALKALVQSSSKKPKPLMSLRRDLDPLGVNAAKSAALEVATRAEAGLIFDAQRNPTSASLFPVTVPLGGAEFTTWHPTVKTLAELWDNDADILRLLSVPSNARAVAFILRSCLKDNSQSAETLASGTGLLVSGALLYSQFTPVLKAEAAFPDPKFPQYTLATLITALGARILVCFDRGGKAGSRAVGLTERGRERVYAAVGKRMPPHSCAAAAYERAVAAAAGKVTAAAAAAAASAGSSQVGAAAGAGPSVTFASAVGSGKALPGGDTPPPASAGSNDFVNVLPAQAALWDSAKPPLDLSAACESGTDDLRGDKSFPAVRFAVWYCLASSDKPIMQPKICQWLSERKQWPMQLKNTGGPGSNTFWSVLMSLADIGVVKYIAGPQGARIQDDGVRVFVGLRDNSKGKLPVWRGNGQVANPPATVNTWASLGNKTATTATSTAQPAAPISGTAAKSMAPQPEHSNIVKSPAALSNFLFKYLTERAMPSAKSRFEKNTEGTANEAANLAATETVAAFRCRLSESSDMAEKEGVWPLDERFQKELGVKNKFQTAVMKWGGPMVFVENPGADAMLLFGDTGKQRFIRKFVDDIVEKNAKAGNFAANAKPARIVAPQKTAVSAAAPSPPMRPTTGSAATPTSSLSTSGAGGTTSSVRPPATGAQSGVPSGQQPRVQPSATSFSRPGTHGSGLRTNTTPPSAPQHDGPQGDMNFGASYSSNYHTNDVGGYFLDARGSGGVGANGSGSGVSDNGGGASGTGGSNGGLGAADARSTFPADANSHMVGTVVGAASARSSANHLQNDFLAGSLSAPDYDPNAALNGMLSHDTRDFVAREPLRGSYDARGGGSLASGMGMRAYEQQGSYDQRPAYEQMYDMRGGASYPSAATAYGFGGVETQHLSVQQSAFDGGARGMHGGSGMPVQQYDRGESYGAWGGGGSAVWGDNAALRGGVGVDRVTMQAHRAATQQQQARGAEGAGVYASSLWGGTSSGNGSGPVVIDDERRFRGQQVQAHAQVQAQQHWGAAAQHGGEGHSYGVGDGGLDASGNSYLWTGARTWGER